MTPIARDGNRWLVLLLVVVTTAVGMMVFAAIFPLLSLWIRDLGISHAQGGLLSGLWYLPGFLVALPAGWMFDRYPVKRMLLLCWLFILAGTTVMALAPGFRMLCVGRLIFSIGMIAHTVGAPKVVSTWFEGQREMGLAMGFYAMSAPIGIFASLNLLGRIGSDYGWRAALYLIVSISAIGFLLLFLLPSGSAASEAKEGATPARFQPFRLGQAAWLLAVGYFGYSIGTEAYLTFTPDYLVERGYGLAVASATVGHYAYASFLLKPVFASFLKRSNAGLFMVLASALAILSVALLLAKVSPTISALTLGVSLALGMPTLYALPPFLFSADKLGQIYGLYQLFYSFGFFAQPLVGYAADKTGGYFSAYILIIAYCALGPLCALPFIRSKSELPPISEGARSPEFRRP